MHYSRHFIALLNALLFSWLFFQRDVGINIFIFDAALLSSLFFFGRDKLKKNTVRLFLAGVILSSIFVSIHNTGWSIFIHHISVFLLGGALAAPELSSVASVIVAGFGNIILSIREYFQSRIPLPDPKKPWVRVWYALRISIIPLLVVILFGTLYSAASPWFKTFWGRLQTFFTDVFGELFEMISFPWLLTLLLGLAITIYILFAKSTKVITEMEDEQPDDLAEPTGFDNTKESWKRERQMALLLFGSLNLMLFGQNILDIIHVWFGFEWNGQVLKGFVHEGTWMLVISIILSAGLVLVFFRSEMNFLNNNRVLKLMAHVFIFQNVFLTASVAMRNYWYIHYYNLAFKRIGVVFFLIAVIYGLYTIYLKVEHKKTLYYLIRKNSMVVYSLLLFIGFFNWNTIIAKYNFAHADSAYVHLKFLATLSDDALPYLQQPLDKLVDVRQDQEMNYGRDKYAITPEEYAEKINERIADFVADYPNGHWLEWNYADWRAYNNLTATE